MRLCWTDSFWWSAERCYKSFQELKTWSAARTHCRAQYADLFTWRNNQDEQFIRPLVHQWATLPQFAALWAHLLLSTPKQQYLAWAGATITSTNRTVVNAVRRMIIDECSFVAHTTKWVDPDGLKLTLQSTQWCDPTRHSGYHSSKEPSLGTKQRSWWIEIFALHPFFTRRSERHSRNRRLRDLYLWSNRFWFPVRRRWLLQSKVSIRLRNECGQYETSDFHPSRCVQRRHRMEWHVHPAF